MSDVEKNIGTHKPEFAGEWVRLGDVVKKAKSARCGSDSYPILSITMHDGIVEQASRFKKSIASRDTGNYKVVEPGQLVVGFPIDEGVIYVQNFNYPGIMSPAYDVWDIDSSRVDPSYLELALHSPQSMDYYKSNLRGTTARRRSLPTNTLCDLTFPLPSLENQRIVVKRMSMIATLLDDASSKLSALDDLVKSQFVEMFGDTYSNSKQLPSRKLGALIDFITSGSRGWSKYYSNEGDYFITIKNVRGCSISLDNVQHVHAPNNKEAERTKVQSGDVLISITADLGRTGVVSTEIADHGAYINQYLACIRLAGEVILPLYLSFFLESPGAKDQLQRKNQTGVKAGLNFDLVKSLDILVPPLALQQQFSDFVARVDKLGFDCCREIVCCGVLFSSMSASLLCT